MPHVGSSGSEDFFSNDEIKVYKDEGEEEKRSSENLSEDKLGLVTESEEGKNSSLSGNYSSSDKANAAQSEDVKPCVAPGGDRVPGSLGYMVSPYPPYPNGASSIGGKMGMVHPPGLVMYNGSELFTQPPPAHMGISPVHIDPKTGIPRPPLYGYSTPSQFPHPLYGPELSSLNWQRTPGYPISTGAFSSAYPPSLMSSRYGPPGLLTPPGIPHPGVPHPAMIPNKDGLPLNQENHRPGDGGPGNNNQEQEKKKPHIKKPLNAFMLFMKEQRAQVVAECTLKESAAINQILGRKWHALDKSEQSKYYDMARKEKELHLQLYPGWSARENYATHNKKKKRKRSFEMENGECGSAKKCRARYGLDQQTEWCKPCRSLNEICEENQAADSEQNSSLEWHALDRSEQAKYYEMARKEKERHMQKYPNWSMRDNYATRTKKKRRKTSSSVSLQAGTCRSKFGLDQIDQWCKPCRTKKKCILLVKDDRDESYIKSDDEKMDL